MQVSVITQVWTYQSGYYGKQDGLGITAADPFMQLQLSTKKLKTPWL
jgi:hypothetical protein